MYACYKVSRFGNENYNYYQYLLYFFYCTAEVWWRIYSMMSGGTPEKVRNLVRSFIDDEAREHNDNDEVSGDEEPEHGISLT